MSLLRQLVEFGLEEASVVTYGEQLRCLDGQDGNAAYKPSSGDDPNSPILEAGVSSPLSPITRPPTNHMTVSSPSYTAHTKMANSSARCFDVCSALLVALAILPLVTFIPAMILQRTSGATGANVDKFSSDGFGFMVHGNWVAALSPIIALLSLAFIGIMRVCCCSLCCGAGGRRDDTDAFVVSLQGEEVAVPLSVRVFPDFDRLRNFISAGYEGVSSSGSDDQQREEAAEEGQLKGSQGREGAADASTAPRPPAELTRTPPPSESAVSTEIFESLLADEESGTILSSHLARRKLMVLIWILVIVQFIVLCVRLQDKEGEQAVAITLALQEISSPNPESASGETSTARRLECGLKVLSSSIASNVTTKSASSLIDASSANGLENIPYERSWAATFVPTMIILFFILVDQHVFV